MPWFDKLMFWRDETPATDAIDDFEINGCFTLPDATLDQLADTPVGGPEDQLSAEDYPSPDA